MRTASIVIVGGGIMGASAAYHLAARGRRDIVVLDRGDGPGRGSTGASTGGFRAQFSTPMNVRLSLLSRQKLLRFAEEMGVDPGYRQSGYLWLAGSREEMAALRAAGEIQRASGLHEAVEVGTADIERLNPAVRSDRVIGGAFCPTDGFLRPMNLLEGFLSAARRLGVQIDWGVEVTGFEMGAGDRIASVLTSRDPIAVESVVNAAGAWARPVAALARVELPVVPLRRQVAITTPFRGLPEDMPMTIFAADGFHLRVRDGRVLLLKPTPGIPGRPFDTRVDSDWVASVVEEARERVPILKEAAVEEAACWAGLYEMSPDGHAVLGPALGCPNLYLINGSSGHGVMHAPALGQLLAEILCDGRASSLEVTALSPERFALGRLNLGPGLL